MRRIALALALAVLAILGITSAAQSSSQSIAPTFPTSSSADWSPNGKQLVFETNRRGTWDPDGTRIAFTGGDVESGYIDVVAADGTGRVRLTSTGADYDPAWSADGKRLVSTRFAAAVTASGR